MAQNPQEVPPEPDSESFVTPEEVKRQQTLIEQVKAWFNVEDDFLAAMLSNQLLMAKQERRENALLKQLREEGFVVNVGDVQIAAPAVEQGMRGALDGELIPFPIPGGVGAFPGDRKIVVDFVEGEAFGIPLKRFTLADLEIENAFGGSLFVDQPVTVTTIDREGAATGKFSSSGAGFLNFANTRVAQLEVESRSGTPFFAGGALHTGLNQPLTPVVEVIGINRFGHVSANEMSSDPTTLERVNFAPLGDNILRLGAVDDQNEEVVNQIGADAIHVGSATHVRMVVQNAGSEDVNYQVLRLDDPNEQAYADSDIHGTVDPTDTITISPTSVANPPDVLESSGSSELLVFRAAAATAPPNNTSELRIQFKGIGPPKR